CFVQAEVVCVGDASGSQQKMAAQNLRSLAVAVDGDGNVLTAPRRCKTVCVELNANSFHLQNVMNGFRNILVFPSDQTRSHFDDRDLAAEPAIHLGELEANVAAAKNDEMIRQEIDIHHGKSS